MYGSFGALMGHEPSDRDEVEFRGGNEVVVEGDAVCIGHAGC